MLLCLSQQSCKCALCFAMDWVSDSLWMAVSCKCLLPYRVCPGSGCAYEKQQSAPLPPDVLRVVMLVLICSQFKRNELARGSHSKAGKTSPHRPRILTGCLGEDVEDRATLQRSGGDDSCEYAAVQPSEVLLIPLCSHRRRITGCFAHLAC